MIIDSLVYVIGKGYLSPSELMIGDYVFTLNKNKIEVSPIERLQSDFISDSINVVNSGQFGSKSTDDTRFLFVNGFGEYANFKWSEIAENTRDKGYLQSKYLPVLTTMKKGDRSYTDSELDGWARLIASGLDEPIDSVNFLRSMTGIDNYVFIEFLETWASNDPGKGYGFSKVFVKTRAFLFKNRRVAEEICRVANFAGWTADLNKWGSVNQVSINFEATPSLGSIPKTQKYYKEPYIGMVYNVDAGNLPILGRTAYNKYCFIPSISCLWEET